MTDQSLRESIKELIGKPIDQYGNTVTYIGGEPMVDAIIACFKDEGWRPIEILQTHSRVWLSKEEVEKATQKPETREERRKCEDVHPDLETDAHGGFHD